MAEDTLLQEAIEALRLGEKAKARDLLTRLLKTDQNNAQYWIWMSAAVETVKERVYCLEAALRLDPENVTAKRGLVLTGTLPPDDSIQPFPINRPRQWEDELRVAAEAERPRGLKAVMTHPAARLMLLLLVVAFIVGVVITGLRMPRLQRLTVRSTITPGPSPTFTLTPTFVNATAPPVSTPAFSGPTPLWMLLDATYTPTPVYVSTPRDVLSVDVFRAAQRASQQGKWEDVINYLQQVATLEPQSADPHYYIAEAYVQMKDYERALAAYEQAIRINPNLGPAYVGRARMLRLLDPKQDILPDLDAAISSDPNYPNAYLERSAYYIEKNNPQAALSDLQRAQQMAPDSPLVYLYYAQAYQALGDTSRALTFAQKAYQMDITLLPVYRLLGQIYAQRGESQKALEFLQVYVQFEPQDPEALVWVGAAYNAAGQYQTALQFLNRSISLNNRLGEAYLQRGWAYIGLKEGVRAEGDFKSAARYLPNSFDVTLGLIQAAILQEHFGDAYLAADALNRLAETDAQRAEVYYWRAYALERLDRHASARPDWEALLALPKGVVPAERLAEAQRYLKAGSTPTRTPTITRTPRPGTPTPTPSRTPTPSPSPTKRP